MSSINDDFYTTVDSLFNATKNTPFADTLPDPVAQQTQGFQGPVGWVQNADALYGGIPTVVIDSDGITITNGRINLADYGGNSVLTAAGFAGSWTSFITDRFYGSHFENSVLNTEMVVSEIGGADTNDEYRASLSAIVPYWIIAQNSGGVGSMQVVSDNNATSGQAISIVGHKSGTNYSTDFYQDVPISQTSYGYRVYVMKNHFASATSTFDWENYITYRDVNHALLGTELSSALSYTTSNPSYANYDQEVFQVTIPGAPPVGTAYIRVGFRVRCTGTTDAIVNITSVRMLPLILEGYGALLAGSGVGIGVFWIYVTGDTSPKFDITDVGAIEWGPGGSTAIDTRLRRGGIGNITIDNGAAGSANLQLLGGVLAFDSGASARLVSTNTDVLQVEGTTASATSCVFWSLGGFRTYTKAGTISDSDISVNGRGDGNFGVDVTNHRWYYREGGAWHYIARTAGFEIPATEDKCPSCGKILKPGDEVIGHLDRNRSDNAVHGLWKHMSCAGKPLNMEIADAYHWLGEEQKSK